MKRQIAIGLSISIVLFLFLGLCIFWSKDVAAAPATSSTGSVSVGSELHFQGTIPQPPSVEIYKFRPHGDVCATHTFWYYIMVTNTGSIPLTGVIIQDKLPAGIDASSVQTGIGPPFTNVPGGSFDGTTATWHIGAILPGDTAWVWIMARTYAWVGGHCITNWAEVRAVEIPEWVQTSEVFCVPAGPTVDFGATPTSGCAPLAVQFKDLSVPGDNPFVSWWWDFGDGTTSTEQNPSHTFAAGVWTVKLTVTDKLGCSSTLVKERYVVSYKPPTAEFSAKPTSGCAPLEVQFTDLSVAGDHPIVSWLWDFGDGTTSTAQNPTHTFAGGTWTVKLTVTDEYGCTDTKVKVQYIDAKTPPTAQFSAETVKCSPLTVKFTDLSVPGDNPLASWLWEFGDGLTSTKQNPLHEYAIAGVYTVKLTVTDAFGCQNTVQQVVTVRPCLDITKVRPHGEVTATWNFWYYIYITNTWHITATNVVVTDTLPLGIVPTMVEVGVGVPFSNGQGGTFDGVNTAVWTFDSLAPNASIVVWIKARTYSWAAGHCLVNQAAADIAEAPPAVATDVACVKAPPTPTPTPTSTPTPTPIPTDTPTATPTETPLPIPTDTPTPIPTDTEVPGPTDTPGPLPTDTETPVPTETLVPTASPTPTRVRIYLPLIYSPLLSHWPLGGTP